jgi:hypothetical protein
MPRKKDPEVKGKRTLNKAVSHLTRQRNWQGDWELIDATNRGRDVSWGQFHDRPNTRIKAVASTTVGGKTWWIAATYESQVTFGALVMFGLVGLDLPKNELSFLVADVDLRTDNKHVWGEDGAIRKYVKSRDEWRKLTGG